MGAMPAATVLSNKCSTVCADRRLSEVAPSQYNASFAISLHSGGGGGRRRAAEEGGRRTAGVP